MPHVAVLSAIVITSLVSACGAQRVRTSPERTGQTLTVLLPDGDGNTVGHASVSSASHTVHLETARDSTVVSVSTPPAPVSALSESEIRQIFGDVLDALPPPAQRFTMYFRFESGELTEESRETLPRILQAIKERPVPDLVVIGHTDTTGSATGNFALGRRRALMIRALLVQAGLDTAAIDVVSHGESDLYVQTADETLEPRNRRVEVSVR